MSTEEKAVALVSRIFPERIPARQHDVCTVAVILQVFVADLPLEVVEQWARHVVLAVDVLRRERSCQFVN